VFIIDSIDDEIRHKWKDTVPWSHWNSLGGSAKELVVTTFEPPFAYLPTEYNVWIIDGNGEVQHNSGDGSMSGWSDWNSLGGSAKELVVATSINTSGPGSFHDVWIIDSNGEVQHKSGDGSQWLSDWESLDFPGSAKEIAVSTNYNPYTSRPLYNVLVVDSNGEVQLKSGVNDWQSISDPGFAKELFVSEDLLGGPLARYDVWIIDGNGAVHHREWTGESILETTATFSSYNMRDGVNQFELIVEDNGWPCDDCTNGSTEDPSYDNNDTGQDDARGSTGKWAVIPITVIVEGDSAKDDPTPSWITFIADQWSKNLISDSEFAEAIKFLITTNVIVIPDLPDASQLDIDEIPQWVKFVAEQWSIGALSDAEFINAIKWLIVNGIIKLS